MTIASFLFFMLLFVGIGLASAFKAKQDRSDYYIASQSISPWLAALSAVATNNSGYMFIGVIGFTYAVGLPAIWLMVGWIFGDFLASLFIHKRLREQAGETNEVSFAAVMAMWSGQDFRHWRRLAALIMVVFLGAYAAAQIDAGGKALQGVLGWDPDWGAVSVALMVLAYSAAGGIRASIWTDAAQSFVMLASMTMLFVVGVIGLGGLAATGEKLAAIPNYLTWFPDELLFPGAAGAGLFVLGWIFAGVSVIGQPHIMVRFMTLKSPAQMTETRIWYYGYFTLFYALATGVGMLARLYLPELGDLDPELALPTMAVELLPPVLVGVILAGIFSATMSTADSLVLSCSAALTHDLLPRRMERIWQIKMATAFVTALALFIALSDTRSVFSLVILSWSTLGCAFGPLLILFVMGRRLDEAQAIATTVSGVALSLFWVWRGWEGVVYEGLIGIIGGLIVGILLSRPKSQARAIP